MLRSLAVFKKLILTILFILVFAASGWGATYYVHHGLGTGDDDGSSWANAWQDVDSVNWAAIAAEASDEACYVYFKKGVIIQSDSAIVSGSGTSDSYRIILTTDPEDSGSDPLWDDSTVVESWTDDDDGTYSKTGISSCYFFLEDDLLITLAANSSVPNPGNWYYDSGGTTLHYRPSSGVAGDHTTKRVPNEKTLMLTDQSYITVENMDFEFCNVGVAIYETATTGSASNYITVKNCDFTKCRVGYSDAPNNSHNWTATVIQDNTFTNCACGVKWTSYPGETATAEHQNSYVQRNTFDGIGYTSGGSGLGWNTATNAVDLECIGIQNINDCQIVDNYMVDGKARGIFLYIKEGADLKDNIIARNWLFNLERTGILIAGNSSGNEQSGNIVSYNIISDCGKDDTGVNCAVRLGNVTLPSETVNIFCNNSLYNNEIHMYLTSPDEYWVVENNIFSTWDTRLIHVGNVPSHVTFGYNAYYTTTGYPFVWDGNPKTLTNWKTDSSDSHEVVADPLFTAVDDFTLQGGSPCIDAGVDLGDSYDDGLYIGSTWPSNVTTKDQDDFDAISGDGVWEIGAYTHAQEYWQWGASEDDKWATWHFGSSARHKGNYIWFTGTGANAWIRSPVMDTGRCVNYIGYFGVGGDRTGVSLKIRGHADSFTWDDDDGTPAWENYVAGKNKAWRFIQVGIEKPAN